MIFRDLWGIVLLLALVAPARAQLHPDYNDIAISFAADAFVAQRNAPASSEFDVYVLLVDPLDGVQATEFAGDGLGSSYVVLEEELLAGAQNSATEPHEFLLSLPECRG